MTTTNLKAFKNKNVNKEACGACNRPMTEKRYRANGKTIICQYCYDAAKHGHAALFEEVRKELDDLEARYKAGEIDPAMHHRARKFLIDNGRLVN